MRHRYAVTTFRGQVLQTRVPLDPSVNRARAKQTGTDTYEYYCGNRTVTVTNLTTQEIIYDRAAKPGSVHPKGCR